MMMTVNTMTKVMYEYVGTRGRQSDMQASQAGNRYTIACRAATNVAGETKQINFRLNALRYRLKKSENE